MLKVIWQVVIDKGHGSWSRCHVLIVLWKQWQKFSHKRGYMFASLWTCHCVVAILGRVLQGTTVFIDRKAFQGGLKDPPPPPTVPNTPAPIVNVFFEAALSLPSSLVQGPGGGEGRREQCPGSRVPPCTSVQSGAGHCRHSCCLSKAKAPVFTTCHFSSL